jgi:hypothetical protein
MYGRSADPTAQLSMFTSSNLPTCRHIGRA